MSLQVLHVAIPGGIELYEVYKLVLALWKVIGSHCNDVGITVIQTCTAALHTEIQISTKVYCKPLAVAVPKV